MSARSTLEQWIPRQADDFDVRGVEWDYLWAQVHGPEPIHAFTHGGAPLLCAAISPDGGLGATGDEGGTIKVWDLRTGEERVSLKSHDVRVVVLQFSDDGRYLASGGSFDRLNVWQTDNWESAQSFKAHDGTVRALDFSADGERIVTGNRHGDLRVWRWRTGELDREATLGGDDEPVVYMAKFTPDGRTVLGATTLGRTFRWDLDQPSVSDFIHHPAPQESSLLAADLSADGRFLVTSGYDGTPICITRVSDQRMLQVPQGVIAYGAAISPSGKWVGIGLSDGLISVIEVAPDFGSLIHRHWFGHTLKVEGVAISPDERLLLTASGDGSAKLWDVQRLPRIGETHIYSPPGAAWLGEAPEYSPNGRWLCWTIQEPASWSVALYDVAAMEITRTLLNLGGPRRVHNPTFSPDSRRLYVHRSSEGYAGWLDSWDVASGEGPVRELAGFEFASAFMPDGERLLVSGWDGVERSVQVWNLRTREIERSLVTGLSYVHDIQISRDGRYVVVSCENHPARLLDLQSGEVRVIGQAPHSFLAHAVLYPDGDRLATFEERRVGQIFDVRTGSELRLLPDQPEGFFGVYEFSPDGELLAIVGGYTESQFIGISLVQARSDRRLYAFHAYGRSLRSAAWSPDGTTIATTTLEGAPRQAMLILWHLSDPERPVR